MSYRKLTWGVKASFRSYVEGVGGAITVSEGAARTETGEITFPAAAGGDLNIAPDGTATGSLRFEGIVTFNAHGGMLNSTLAELALEATEDGLVLTCLDAPMNQQRCAIAKLDPVEVSADGVITMGSAITDDGMYQIADNYPTGTELDPLWLE